MKVQVENLDRVRKKIDVSLDAEQVQGLEELIYDELKKRARIKGFRPGKVPRSIIQTYYKDFIEEEIKKKVVEATMVDALTEAKVAPVSEPRVTFPKESPQAYSMECEVAPEFDLPQYAGLELNVDRLKVTDEEVDNRVEALKQMHAQLVNREPGDKAQNGDFAVVKYEGFVDGKAVPEARADAYPLEIGTGNLLPEFERALMGMKTGDEKEIEIDFPADYPAKDVAGKKAQFKLTLKELKEKRLPEINDEFAKDLGLENLTALRERVTEDVTKEKEAQRKNAMTEQIVDALVAGVDIPVPAKLLERRLDMMVQDARQRMGVEHVKEEEDQTISAALRKELEPQAERRIRAGMILARIAEKEGITVDDAEVDERLKRIAEESKRAYDYVRQFYEKYNLFDGLKTSMLDEKAVQLLIDQSVVKEKE